MGFVYQRGVVTWIVLVALVNAAILSMPMLGWAGCDDEAPSGSMEACHVPAAGETTCSGFADNETDCNSPTNGFVLEVKEDFPVSCIEEVEGKNCNRPLKDCWRPTNCMWNDAAGECGVDPDSNESWNQKKKRIPSDC